MSGVYKTVFCEDSHWSANGKRLKAKKLVKRLLTTMQGSSDEGLNKGCDRQDAREGYFREKRLYWTW